MFSGELAGQSVALLKQWKGRVALMHSKTKLRLVDALFRDLSPNTFREVASNTDFAKSWKRAPGGRAAYFVEQDQSPKIHVREPACQLSEYGEAEF